jgi:hypothetical protein
MEPSILQGNSLGCWVDEEGYDPFLKPFRYNYWQMDK